MRLPYKHRHLTLTTLVVGAASVYVDAEGYANLPEGVELDDELKRRLARHFVPVPVPTPQDRLVDLRRQEAALRGQRAEIDKKLSTVLGLIATLLIQDEGDDEDDEPPRGNQTPPNNVLEEGEEDEEEDDDEEEKQPPAPVSDAPAPPDAPAPSEGAPEPEKLKPEPWDMETMRAAVEEDFGPKAPAREHARIFGVKASSRADFLAAWEEHLASMASAG